MGTPANPSSFKENGEYIGFGTPELRVETIPCWLARVIISNKHYSKRFVNNSTLHLGVFSGRELVGVLQFGYALNPSSAKSIVEGTANDEYLELNRMWIHDKMERNTESRVIRYSLKLIKLARPKVRWVQSFADERCGGLGVVYQASNFTYLGAHMSRFFQLDGDWYHELAITRKGGKRGDYLKANIERASIHYLKQFRYIFFLKKSARKKCLFKEESYPKPGVDIPCKNPFKKAMKRDLKQV